MMIVTFYSYKGGVGRSLALANIACLLAEDEEHPQHVLVWDFDLEAPGLHKLFPPKQPQNYGFVDLAYEYATTGKIPQVDDYIYESVVRGVDVLPAGKLGVSYCDKLQHIDWPKFFGSDKRESGYFFGKLLKGLREREKPYDYILVDSRTGLNDQAGICTQVLSDQIIVLFRLNEQNIDGLEYLIPAVRSQLKKREKEKVKILPVASQVGASAKKTISVFRMKAEKIFGEKFQYIRFDQDLVSEEKLFCLKEEMEEMWPIPPVVEDYKHLSSSIRRENKEDTATQVRNLRQIINEGNTETAVTMLCALIQRRPLLSRAWRELAKLYSDMSKSRRKELKEIVAKVLDDDPANIFACRWNAAMHASEATGSNSKELIEAKKFLMVALKNSPERNKTSIWREIASIESCRGDHESAVKAFREAISLSPKNNQLRLELAVIYMRMGAKYFAVACEELDGVSEDIGGRKQLALAYLRTFLEEPEKAAEAYEACDEESKPLVKAHMLLIQGKKKEAREMVKYNISSSKGYDLANWIEFYICSGDFDNAISLGEEFLKTEEHVRATLRHIVSLAKFLKTPEKDIQNEKNDLLTTWSEKSWSFRELLMFRECSIKAKSVFVGRLEIIEDIIRCQELEEVRSSGLGLFSRLEFKQLSMQPGSFRVVFE